MGVAHQRMADILEQLGKSSEANAEHRKAIAIFETLIEADPREDWAKWNAAISYDKLGDRLLSTDEEAATELYQKSLDHPRATGRSDACRGSGCRMSGNEP